MPGHTYREDRVALTDVVKRIALDPLEIEGVPVTSLLGGEYVRYTVYRADKSLWIAETNASYETIFTNNEHMTIEAWSGLINTPPSLPAGATSETLIIKWEYQIGAAHNVVFDHLQVNARPV